MGQLTMRDVAAAVCAALFVVVILAALAALAWWYGRPGSRMESIRSGLEGIQVQTENRERQLDELTGRKETDPE